MSQAAFDLHSKPINVISSPLGIHDMPPAAGQGALAIVVRRDDARAISALTPLCCTKTALAVATEKAFMRAVDPQRGGDHVFAAHVSDENRHGVLRLDVWRARADGTQIVSTQRSLAGLDEAQAVRVARKLGVKIGSLKI